MKNIPIQIKQIIKNLKYTKDNIGRSEDIIYIFENKYILKISNNINRLKQEYQKINWLEDKIPSSKSILFIEENNKAYYLRTYLNGETLINNRFISNPNLLIKTISKAVNLLKTLNNYNCPFNSTDNTGNEFIHGDLCLPNIIVNQNNEVIGFIDLDNSGLGDIWYDYSWLIWSFEYNLKTNKYTNLLLKELNIEFNQEKYNFYIPEEYRN